MTIRSPQSPPLGIILARVFEDTERVALGRRQRVQIVLSPEVPKIVSEEISRRGGLSLQAAALDERPDFIGHPGGPKVMMAMCTELEENALEKSWKSPLPPTAT